MPTTFGVIVIDKKGVIKQKQLQSFDQVAKNIYKKCSTSRNATPDEYPKLTTWEISDAGKEFYIDLYGKKSGRAGTENKYELPYPVDDVLLFNSFALVKYSKTKANTLVLENLTPALWNKYYNMLMGGFEELHSNDTDEDVGDVDDVDSEPEKVNTKTKTTHGYVKDGFVVESKNPSESGKDSDDESSTDTDDDDEDPDLSLSDDDDSDGDESDDDDDDGGNGGDDDDVIHVKEDIVVSKKKTTKKKKTEQEDEIYLLETIEDDELDYEEYIK